MRATLAHRGADTDERALDLATLEHVSQFDEPDRGRGLPTAVRLVTGQRGSLYLASGTASVRRFAGTRRRLVSAAGYPGHDRRDPDPAVDGTELPIVVAHAALPSTQEEDRWPY